jgi:hypothetical protein
MTKLDCYSFGRRLLSTNDLDPVYVLLHEAKLPLSKLKRWLVAYWCFYHIGTASWITDGGPSYWQRFHTAANSKEYPRCHERRHFRGANATKSTTYLQGVGLEGLWKPLLDPYNPNDLESVMKYVQTWVGFGPWIAFKVADMLERLELVPVKFNSGAMFLFDSPRQGAELLASLENPDTDDVNSWAVERILGMLGTRLAPPRYERQINSQEAETVLCKWKSHMNGHYDIGEDIESCKKSLERFKDTPTSKLLYQSGRTAFQWSE